jgi:hypothetical protein
MGYVKCINVACSNYCLNGTCAENKIDCFYRDVPVVDFVDEPSHSIYEGKRNEDK